MEFLRLFIALPLPESIKQHLHELQENLKSLLPHPEIRWTTPEQWHLTLIFLGTTPSEKLSAIQKAMQGTVTRLESFELSTTNLGTFPSPQRPSVLWLGLTGQTENLQVLHHRLSQNLGSFFEPEERSFKAHITLARIKQFGLGKEVRKAFAEVTVTSQHWKVEEVVLYSSLLKPSGSEYTKLHEVRLGIPTRES